MALNPGPAGERVQVIVTVKHAAQLQQSRTGTLAYWHSNSRYERSRGLDQPLGATYIITPEVVAEDTTESPRLAPYSLMPVVAQVLQVATWGPPKSAPVVANRTPSFTVVRLDPVARIYGMETTRFGGPAGIFVTEEPRVLPHAVGFLPRKNAEPLAAIAWRAGTTTERGPNTQVVTLSTQSQTSLGIVAWSPPKTPLAVDRVVPHLLAQVGLVRLPYGVELVRFGGPAGISIAPNPPKFQVHSLVPTRPFVIEVIQTGLTKELLPRAAPSYQVAHMLPFYTQMAIGATRSESGKVPSIVPPPPPVFGRKWRMGKRGIY